MNLSNRKLKYGAAALVLVLALLAWWLLRSNPNVRKVRELQAAMRQLPPEQRPGLSTPGTDLGGGGGGSRRWGIKGRWKKQP